MNPVTDEMVETAAKAWWEAKRDGKRIANCSWAETKPEWRADYLLRARAALEAVLL